MRARGIRLTAAAVAAAGLLAGGIGTAKAGPIETETAWDGGDGSYVTVKGVHLGTRPFYLLDEMSDGELKDQLSHCAEKKKFYRPHAFSIGHRGAPLLYPEHTKESYVNAARMGAGILECDVTFTKDAELVCRHAQCDLHTTTDIVAREDLRGKCAVPPQIDATTGELLNAEEIKCCASDLTLAEFKSPKRQDGRGRPFGHHHRRLSGRHGGIPHRPFCHRRQLAESQRKHRTL